MSGVTFRIWNIITWKTFFLPRIEISWNLTHLGLKLINSSWMGGGHFIQWGKIHFYLFQHFIEPLNLMQNMSQHVFSSKFFCISFLFHWLLMNMRRKIMIILRMDKPLLIHTKFPSIGFTIFPFLVLVPTLIFA